MEIAPVQKFARRLSVIAVAGFLICMTLGCPTGQTNNPAGGSPPITLGPVKLQAVNFSDLTHPTPHDQPVVLAAAANEWTDFVVQVSLPAPQGFWLRIDPVQGPGGLTIPLSSYSAYQILSMPVDMDRAGYVRHSGRPAERRSIPRALLPQPIDNGNLNLHSLRNPLLPTDPRSHAGGPGADPALVWFDLHVPSKTPPGEYTTQIHLMNQDDARGPQSLLTLPVRLTVYDFELPDERHLQMVGRLGWDRLKGLYPDSFENSDPYLVNRHEEKYQSTVRTLDHLVAMAQENRAALVIPALKPVVKWPVGVGPQIDWEDFDSVVRPWFSGDAFADRVGLRYWPLPEAEMLGRYVKQSQLQYWTAAAQHFDAEGWLSITAISLENQPGARPDPQELVELSSDAADLLKCHPAMRVLLPLEDDQIAVASADNPVGIDASTASRLLTAGATLVSTPKPPPWQGQLPRHWLRTDLPGLVPYVGAGGDEHDVRVWAWLAFLRHLDAYGKRNVFEQNFILWNTTLPLAGSPDQSADPGELVWFYPGRWFGVNMPLPTVQLKWLRREQDYEYLIQAQSRGEVLNAVQLARLVTKPVELDPGQHPDPTYALMTGTSSREAWADAEKLLADTILLRKPGQTADPGRQQELDLRTLQLSTPQEKRLLLGRSAKWSFNTDPPNPRDPGRWVNLTFSLDIYNASETTPNQNTLRWVTVPPGFQIDPQQVVVPQLKTYHVQPASLNQKVNLNRIVPASRDPMELEFVDGFNESASRLKISLPVAKSDRHEGELIIDGKLNDWSPEDIIQDGPMVTMLNRPALQAQELRLASTNSTVYSTWGHDNFYIAFALNGLDVKNQHAQNFVDYQQRRAWGEDLCEILIQPIFRDNTVGPVLHAVCKPNGGLWLERKTDARPSDGGWKALDASAARYSATTQDTAWHGEVAIPWFAITDKAGDPPTLLRFNFSQHKAATGESASWAGPLDFGRDETFMGLIYLRSPNAPGLLPGGFAQEPSSGSP